MLKKIQHLYGKQYIHTIVSKNILVNLVDLD